MQIKQTMKTRQKIKLPLFLLLAVLAAITVLTSISASHNFITEVIINEITVFDGSTIEPLAIETGETLFVTVKLKSVNISINDVSVEAVIRGVEAGTIRTETSLFDMKAGKTYAKFLTLRIPENIKLADTSDDFVLRIIASNDHEDRIDIPLTVDRIRHNLVVLDVQAPSEVRSGETALVEVAARNRGIKTEEDVFIKASIPELGVSRQKFIGDLTPTEKKDDDLSDKAVALLRLEIPADAKSGEYALRVVAYTLDGVAKGEETTTIVVVGKAAVVEKASAIAVDETSKTAQRGQGIVYKVTITNLADAAQTYSAVISGVDFGVARVDPAVLTLAAKETGTLNVFVAPTETASLGEHAFTVVVSADGEAVKSLSLRTNVGTVAPTADRLRQNLIIIAVILVIVLIVLAIIIAVTTGRRTEEGEEKYY